MSIILLHSEMNYIDGITIINNDGIILFTVKFNPDIDEKMEETIVGKKLSEVFYNINKSNSSLYECIEKECLIERRGQLVKNTYMEDTITDNVSFPIKHAGLIVGAIELSKRISVKPNRANDKKALSDGNGDMNLKSKCLDLGFMAKYTLNDIVCRDKKMVELVKLAASIASSSSPVFITGETGTGKELFAQGIHNASNRRGEAFIAQNCSAVPENLIESIFFGTSKGSYTGAVDKKGLFEACDGGTLFLDELHCMPIHLQAKLLRVIENGAVRRVGETEERSFDVRIIAATNVKAEEVLNKGHIRYDLYYRLSVVKINIPPLRERIEDIQVLSDFFIKKYNKVFEKNIVSVSSEIENFMFHYAWPGNVRELENFVESAILYAQNESEILEDRNLSKDYSSTDELSYKKSLKDILEDTELTLINEALSIYKGNVKKSAEYLGLPRQTLQQKILKYKLKSRKTGIQSFMMP